MKLDTLAQDMRYYWQRDIDDRIRKLSFPRQAGVTINRPAIPQPLLPSGGTGGANSPREYYAHADFGANNIIGSPAAGPLVDESVKLRAILKQVGEAGGGTLYLTASRADYVIHIAQVITSYFSNLHIDGLGQEIVFGPQGSLRHMGELSEQPSPPLTAAAGLRANSTTDANDRLVLPLRTGEGTAFPVGRRVVVRGENDANGKTLEAKTDGFVVVQSGNDITLNVDKDDAPTYQPTYPGSAWPADATSGTTIYMIAFSRFVDATVNPVNVTAGQRTVFVQNASIFPVGSYVVASDRRTENGVRASAIRGSGTPYTGPGITEIKRIVARDISTNSVTFESPLQRSMNAADFAGIALMNPLYNVSIRRLRIRYSGDQTTRSYHALQMSHCINGTVEDIYIDGIVDRNVVPTTGRRANGIRLHYTYNCRVTGCTIDGSGGTGSGEGYGIAAYYTSYTLIDANHTSGLRHGVLVQGGTYIDVISNTCEDCRINGIDTHGVNEISVNIANNVVNHGDINTVDSSNEHGIGIGNTSHTVGSHRVVVRGNHVTGFQSGIVVCPASSNIIVQANHIYQCVDGLALRLNSKQCQPVEAAVDVYFLDNQIVGATGRAVNVSARPTFDNVNSVGRAASWHVSGNVTRNCVEHFRFTSTAAGGIDYLTIERNSVFLAVPTAGVYAYQCNQISNTLRLIDNYAMSTARGVNVTACADVRLLGNRLTDIYEGQGVWLVESGNTSYYSNENQWDVTQNINGSILVTGTGTITVRRDNRIVHASIQIDLGQNVAAYGLIGSIPSAVVSQSARPAVVYNSAWRRISGGVESAAPFIIDVNGFITTTAALSNGDLIRASATYSID